MATLKLDLGCGRAPLDGFTGVDLPPPRTFEPLARFLECTPPKQVRPAVLGWDLGNGLPWPFEAESVTELRSAHLIEHLQSSVVPCYDRVSAADDRLEFVGYRDVLCRFMDEAWRVAQPGALFTLVWPAILDESDSGTGRLCIAALQDPTHRRFIPTAQLHYFSRAGREMLGVADYPIACDWLLERLDQVGRVGIPPHVFLENVAHLRKPGRAAEERS